MHPKQDEEQGEHFSLSTPIDCLANQFPLPQDCLRNQFALPHEKSAMKAVFQGNHVGKFVQDQDGLSESIANIDSRINKDLINNNHAMRDVNYNCMEDGHCSLIIDDLQSSLFTNEMSQCYEKKLANDLTTSNFRNLQTSNVVNESQNSILDTRNYSCQSLVTPFCNPCSTETTVNDFDDLLHYFGRESENLNFSLSTATNSLTNQFSLSQESNTMLARFQDNCVEEFAQSGHAALETNPNHVDPNKEGMGDNKEVNMHITKDLIEDNVPLLDDGNIIMDANCMEGGHYSLLIDDLHSSLFSIESPQHFETNFTSDLTRPSYDIKNFETINLTKESLCGGFVLDNDFCQSDTNSIHQPCEPICTEPIIKDCDETFQLSGRETEIADLGVCYNSPEFFFNMESSAFVDKEDQKLESNSRLTSSFPKFPCKEAEVMDSLELAHNPLDKSSSLSVMKDNEVESRLEDYLQDFLEENHLCDYLASHDYLALPSWDSEISYSHYIPTDSYQTFKNDIDQNKISNDDNVTGVPYINTSNLPVPTISIINGAVPSCPDLKKDESQMQVDIKAQTNSKVMHYTDDEIDMDTDKQSLKMIFPSSNKRISLLNTDFLNKKSSNQTEHTQSISQNEQIQHISYEESNSAFSEKNKKNQLSCHKRKSRFKISTLGTSCRTGLSLQKPSPRVQPVSCSLTNETMPVSSALNNADNATHTKEASAVTVNNAIGETNIGKSGTSHATHNEYLKENCSVVFPEPDNTNTELAPSSGTPSKTTVNVIGTFGKPEECSCYCVNVGMKDQYVRLRVRDMLKMSVKKLLSMAGHGQKQVKSEQEIATEKCAERNYLFERKRRRLFNSTMRQCNFMGDHDQQ